MTPQAAGDPVQQLSAHLFKLRLPVDTLPPYNHTNAYLIADAGVGLLVDPGAADEAAVAILDQGLQRASVRLLKGIALTHTHPDHTGGVQGVRQWRAAEGDDQLPLYVHVDEARRLPEEWRPVVLQGERTLMVGDVAVRCLHTPGHSPGHLTFLLENAGQPRPEAAIVGDLAVAEGSVWVGRPEGDVAQYLGSLDRIAQLAPRVVAPAHGDAILKVQKRLEQLVQHRLEREAQILELLDAGPATAAQLTAAIYAGQSPEMLEYAQQSVLAQLLKLMNEMRVLHLGQDESGPYAIRR
jgi:glyoxylase-like metal-dependent hydrolase (beta-lactamase superfamily II)